MPQRQSLLNNSAVASIAAPPIVNSSATGLCGQDDDERTMLTASPQNIITAGRACIDAAANDTAVD